MYNTSTMHLIYQNHKGQEFSQHWRDLTEMGTLVDPETGEDLELIGWRSDTAAATEVEVQAAWHAGLDAGREQGRVKDHAHPSPSAPVGVEGLMQLARNWCLAWGEWAHDADPDCAKENAAEAELRAALTTALAQQPAACPKCDGTGEADSGGIHPWGAPATIPCDCQQPAQPWMKATNQIPGSPLERIVRRRDDVCEWCDVQGRCSSGTKYVWVHGKGRVESPCACSCHSSPSKKPPNT